MKFFRQAEAAECGLASVAMIAAHHGRDVDLGGLRLRFGASLKGATLLDLKKICDNLGLATRAVRLEMSALTNLATPAILHWDLDHFVVLEHVGRRKATILDPAFGARRMKLAEVAEHFTGVALEIEPLAGFEEIAASNRIRLSDLWSRIAGGKRALLHLLVLSLALQLFVALSPLFTQLAIDEAIFRQDVDFLLLLAVSFGALHVLRAGTEALRAWAILWLGHRTTFQLAGNVLRHLLRLPTDFFQKRHVGDVMSRMGSIEAIQAALTQGVVAAFIDAMMAIVTAVLIMLYDIRLAAIVFFSGLLYLAVAVATYPARRAREEEEIAARAAEQTHLIETVRAARAVKLFGREFQREAAWRNLFVKVVNAGLRGGRLEIGVGFAEQSIFSLSLVAIVYVAGHSAISGDFTIGMLTAFLAYRQNFNQRISNLVAEGVRLRMLTLHLDRLSDIVCTAAETNLERPKPLARTLEGRITLERVNFRYAQGEPAVLSDASIELEPGDFAALVGPSGGGKSTLLHVILGLLRPDSGEVRVDGQSIDKFGVIDWRARVGAVMQDDQLLSGTIADNITFFDPEPETQRMIACARMAQLHDDLMAMPMNYLSIVGDMGDALSGGQRQRLLIARALYREPAVLFLDEGTANLDPQSEAEIADLLSNLPITRLAIAHRPELVRRANRVFELRDGVVRELSSEERIRDWGGQIPLSKAS